MAIVVIGSVVSTILALKETGGVLRSVVQVLGTELSTSVIPRSGGLPMPVRMVWVFVVPGI